jgi:hypothetical protein
MLKRIKWTWFVLKGTWELISDIIKGIRGIKSPYLRWIAISFVFLMVGFLVIGFTKAKIKI